MENTMILKSVSAVTEGTKDGKPWKRCTAVFETIEKFPKTVAVTCLGTMVDVVRNFKRGHLLRVKVDADSHEYEGKWFTELRAWSIKPAYEIPKDTEEAPAEQKDNFDSNVDPL